MGTVAYIISDDDITTYVVQENNLIAFANLKSVEWEDEIDEMTTLEEAVSYLEEKCVIVRKIGDSNG